MASPEGARYGAADPSTSQPSFQWPKYGESSGTSYQPPQSSYATGYPPPQSTYGTGGSGYQPAQSSYAGSAYHASQNSYSIGTQHGVEYGAGSLNVPPANLPSAPGSFTGP